MLKKVCDVCDKGLDVDYYESTVQHYKGGIVIIGDITQFHYCPECFLNKKTEQEIKEKEFVK